MMENGWRKLARYRYPLSAVSRMGKVAITAAPGTLEKATSDHR